MHIARINFATDIADIALQWLAADRRARFMVDRDLRIMWTNAEAGALFDSRIGMYRHDDQLMFATSENERAFRTFLTAPDASDCCLALRGGGDGRWLLFHAYSIDRGDHGGVVGIEVQADDRATDRYHDLGIIFALTPAEHKIVLHLLDGLSATTIAERLGIAVGTVRTHVRRIYQKINVSSREGLMCALRPYCVA